MARVFVCFMFAIVVIGNVVVALKINEYGIAKHHNKRNNKKYIIEVQDHQSAMKAANPIVDLEDSVRRGINDPLADPRFVMNRINDDFFGAPMADNSLHNSELLAYQGKDRMSASPFMSLSALNGRFSPSNPIQQQASKEGYISRHPASMPTFQNIGLPKQPIRQVPFSRRPMQTPLSFRNIDVTANIAQNVAGGLSQGLPGGVAAFLSKGKLAPFANGVSIGTISPQRNLGERASSFSHIAGGQNRLIHQKLLNRIAKFHAAPQHNSYFQSPPKNNINPLTGLPEDLEDRSYGSVSSITSVSDEPAPTPSSITVETSESSPDIEKNDKHQTLSSQHQASYQEAKQEQSRQATTLESLHNDKSTSEDNFSSLKDYLEADNALRESLAKDGIESIDPSKKIDSVTNRRTIPMRLYH